MWMYNLPDAHCDKRVLRLKSPMIRWTENKPLLAMFSKASSNTKSFSNGEPRLTVKLSHQTFINASSRH